MSLRGQRVVLPCVSFGVKLRLGQPGGGLSPMEQVALEAIALGVRSPESLGDILGLGRRPTLDLLLDFWRKGWVWVEENGTVQLSGEAEKAAQTGKWEALKSSEQNMVQVRLIQELLTGAVLPLLGSIRPEGANAELVPCERNKLDLSDVARTEIRKAAELELERQKRAERAERNLEILEAWLEPEDLLREVQGQSAGIGERRYLSLWVDVRRDLDSHVLVFTVVHAPDVPI
ncbi:MAG TPA: hypothetical protein PKW90_24375, partial [Myxococcota bacterium]|nr:hypothetical protein [Myxococcota bacterium]